jgi:GTP-binding protein
MVVQTDWDNDEAVAYLQRRFDRIGLDDLLAKNGCVQGDEVRILGFEFSYDGDKKQEAVSPEEDDLTDDDELIDEDAFDMGEDD